MARQSFPDAHHHTPTTPYSGQAITTQSPECLVSSAARAGATDVYNVQQSLLFAAATIDFTGGLLRFPNETAAATWLSNRPAALQANASSVKLIADAPTAGDESLTFTSADSSGPNRVVGYVRVGTDVALLRLESDRPAQFLDELATLLALQAGCLAATVSPCQATLTT